MCSVVQRNSRFHQNSRESSGFSKVSIGTMGTRPLQGEPDRYVVGQLLEQSRAGHHKTLNCVVPGVMPRVPSHPSEIAGN